MNALRTFHALCKTPDFREVCLNDHKFTTSTFDGFVKEALLLFKKGYDLAYAKNS